MWASRWRTGTPNSLKGPFWLGSIPLKNGRHFSTVSSCSLEVSVLSESRIGGGLLNSVGIPTGSSGVSVIFLRCFGRSRPRGEGAAEPPLCPCKAPALCSPRASRGDDSSGADWLLLFDGKRTLRCFLETAKVGIETWDEEPLIQNCWYCSLPELRICFLSKHAVAIVLGQVRCPGFPSVPPERHN